MSIWTILFVILLIAWLGGFTVFHVAGGLIHLLLVFALKDSVSHCAARSRLTRIRVSFRRGSWPSLPPARRRTRGEPRRA